MQRNFPQLSELRPLLQFERPSLDFRANRLAKAADLWDLRRIARRRTPQTRF